MKKTIHFKVTLDEVMALPASPTSLSFEQELLRLMKSKGLVTKGTIILSPVGELTWKSDPERLVTEYWQTVEDE